MDDCELEQLLTAVKSGDLTVVEAAKRLRDVSGDASSAAPRDLFTDEVRVIETHIDDMNPELLGFFMDRLLEEGALDVAFSSLQMKKNRPAVKLTVITPPLLLDRLCRMILHETTAIGVRHYAAERLKLERAAENRQTSLGEVTVKVLREGERVVRVAPEYEECRRLAQATGLPLLEVYQIVERETGARR